MKTVYSADEMAGLSPEGRVTVERMVEAAILHHEVERMAYIEDGFMPEYESEGERLYNRELLAAYGFDPDVAEARLSDDEED